MVRPIMFIGLLLVGASVTVVEVKATWAGYEYMYCYDNSPTPELPNLTKSTRANGGSNVSVDCFGILTASLSPPAPFNTTFTWYYYESYPQSCGDNECCHNTSTSVFESSQIVRQVVGGSLITTGNIRGVAGRYMGLNGTITNEYHEVNPLKCFDGIGVEVQTGSVIMNITGGPTCTGIHILENCPGMTSNFCDIFPLSLICLLGKK